MIFVHNHVLYHTVPTCAKAYSNAPQVLKRNEKDTADADGPWATMKKLFAVLVLGFSLALGALAQDQEADTAFFSKVRLGMTIDEAGRQKAADVSMLWHSDAPPGQEQVHFRNRTVPQRRIYVYYSVADNKIVSVSYAKLGVGETFSKAEQDHLVKLNGNPKELKVILSDDGSEFEVKAYPGAPQVLETQ